MLHSNLVALEWESVSISQHEIKKKFHDLLKIDIFFCIAGAQNPGGDKGIDPNALKSLVG